MADKTQAVQRMQDYIAGHLNERITPAQLAEAALFSPFYAARIFAENLSVCGCRTLTVRPAHQSMCRA